VFTVTAHCCTVCNFISTDRVGNPIKKYVPQHKPSAVGNPPISTYALSKTSLKASQKFSGHDIGFHPGLKTEHTNYLTIIKRPVLVTDNDTPSNVV
jgi:hypothetical protein